MHKALKAKWVKALCSGEYQQCVGELKNGDGKYCCLGVLAEVSGLKDFENNCFQGATEAYLQIEEWMGPEVVHELWILNDDEQVPFDVIAGFIQENL